MLDIRRFGPGKRRAEPPPNCRNMHTAIILNDRSAAVIELHFLSGGDMWEHAADHPILFTVIEGKGRVRVGGEEAELSSGEAVFWPAGKPHKAWADGEPFTAIAFEYDIPVRDR